MDKGDITTMKSQIRTQGKTGISLSFKCGAVLLLFVFSTLIVACNSESDTNTVNTGNPAPTITIRIGETSDNISTPPLPLYWCGAWAAQTSPAFSSTSMVDVYAKFTQNVNGNPQGIEDATATATVLWPDGTPTTQTVTTTADGLAVFMVSTANHAFAINRLTLVTVIFTKETQTCTVGTDRAAFFTLVVAPLAPRATKGPSDKHH